MVLFSASVEQFPLVDSGGSDDDTSQDAVPLAETSGCQTEQQPQSQPAPAAAARKRSLATLGTPP